MGSIESIELRQTESLFKLRWKWSWFVFFNPLTTQIWSRYSKQFCRHFTLLQLMISWCYCTETWSLYWLFLVFPWLKFVAFAATEQLLCSMEIFKFFFFVNERFMLHGILLFLQNIFQQQLKFSDKSLKIISKINILRGQIEKW